MNQPRKTLKERMAEKRKLIDSGHEISENTLSNDEKNQMSFFLESIDRMCDLLKKENNSIKSGNLDIINELFEMKKEGLRTIENKAPLVEHLINSDSFPESPKKIKELKMLVDENGVLLERMNAAAKVISSELNKIKNKHSLNGLYEKTGKKINQGHISDNKLDQNL